MHKKARISLAATILIAAPLAAQSAIIDDDAETVQLRKSCIVENEELNNCFTNTYTMMNWIKSVRKPNETRPLKVDIGPGTFRDNEEGGSISLFCNPSDDYTGHITFRGAGAQQTIMDAEGSIPVRVRGGCTHLNFSDFTITSTYNYITWNGGGDSRWFNMEILTPGAVWTERTCGLERGKHYWFSSRLVFGTVASDRGYLASCDESWFFGTEIHMTRNASPATTSATKGFALKATDQGEIHVYGGNIRALGVETSTPVIQAINGGEIHIHGTGIDLKPDPGVNAILLFAGPGGMIHAISNGYSFTPTEGSTITRVLNDNGHIHAPHLWEAHPEPPAIASVTGADLAVITNTDDGQPHLVIYSSTCPGSWYNTTTKSCH